jgi:hypothetical protein
MSGSEQFRNIAPAPLLPAMRRSSIAGDSTSQHSPTDSNMDSSSTNDRPTRRKLAVACGGCRSRKQKCDGQRPVCTPCRIRKAECVFETQPDETRFSAIKRRTENLEKEAQDYREVVTNLRVRPEDEAQHLLQHLRSTRTFNITQVLESIRAGLDFFAVLD